MVSMAAVSHAWLANPWLAWGVGPYIASNLGFLLTALVLEVVAASGIFASSQLLYASSNYTPRQKLLAETQKRISFRLVRLALHQCRQPCSLQMLQI